MSSDCIFCKIANKQIPAELIEENDQIVAFRDINPQAPIHVQIIPRRHIATTNELGNDTGELLGAMFAAARALAQREGIDETGYRLVMNCNGDGGQSVYHIHLHLLGGRRLNWPPG